jgi:hypothetical protein
VSIALLLPFPLCSVTHPLIAALEQIVLVCCDFRSGDQLARNVPSFRPFVALTTLDISCCEIQQESLASLLSVHTTPKLRVLAAKGFYSSRIGGYMYTPSFPSDLLPRLEKASLDMSDFNPPYQPHPASDKILWRGCEKPAEILRLCLSHVALRLPSFGGDPRYAVTTLHGLHSLCSPSSPVKSVIIVKSESSTDELPAVVQRAFNRLALVGRQRGIDIRWSEGDAFEDFGRYLRRKERESSVGGRQ